ncbi:MAG: hypothetical protein AAGE99_01650 [Chlamydiota bacterium]
MSERTEAVKQSSTRVEANGQVLADPAIKTTERVAEQTQVDVARSRKTYEGTTIKIRNPILVTMLIMTIVTDALKDSADKTKEITKLEKRIWKHHSDGQSANFKQGENCQKYLIGAKLVNIGCEMAANRYDGDQALLEGFIPFNGKSAFNNLGTMVNGYADSVFPQEQQRIQIEDAKFQYRVGHTGSDYQNQSQQVSSDNQMVDSAREKGIQLGRLMVQLITAQPV